MTIPTKQHEKPEAVMSTVAQLQAAAPGESVALGEVVEAIIVLSSLNEVDLADLVSSGALKKRFPFKVSDTEQPLSRFDDIEEAPSRSLSDVEYQRFLRGD